MIRLTDVEMQYPNGVQAIRGISMTIEDGEFVFMVGPSGSGKSTIIKLLTAEVEPTAGRIMINGFSVNNIAERQIPYMRRTVGVIFQDFRLIEKKSVYENLAFAMRAVGSPSKTIKNRIGYVLELVGLENKARRLPSELSGGEQQRVALARALVTKPSILLLDEPLSALDRKVRAEMQYEIRNLQRKIGTTTVFVTHDQEEALTMSDQIILLHDGQIEQQGDPFTIYSQPASVFASDFLGKANLLSGTLACEDGVWYVCSENVRIPVNHVGGREGDTVKAAVRGEYFEFCSPETEGANPFHLEKKIFTGLSWKLIGTLGAQPLDISALGTHAGTLSEGDDLFVRIRPENVVYYNNN